MENLFGRTVIYTDYDVITKDNLLDIIQKASATHEKNSREIDYLFDYYKGNQPILDRTKEYNSGINNKIVENRANEIVTFKVGYLMSSPIQYINQTDDEYSEIVQTLNDYMRYEDKEAKDKALVTWNTICGTAYRLILPDENIENLMPDEAPFEIYTLDPRNTFVIYNSGLGERRLAGVTILNTIDEKGDKKKKYVGYTETDMFEIVDNEITVFTPHALGGVPIIEYPSNEARLGAFEIVLPLLDSLNTLQSNRVDGIEQLIQSILVLKGTDLTAEQFEEAKAMGGLKIPADGDAFFISTVLNQTETQTLVNYVYDSILTICGMPNRNGGSSTSDTGQATFYRDGWQDAEGRASDSEGTFKSSEREFLKFALRTTNSANTDAPDLRISHIEIRFTRRNYENIQMKSQVLISMLNNEKIHPKLAFEHSGMFVDPELAYAMSENYIDTNIDREQKEINNFLETDIAEGKANVEEEV